MASVTKYRCDHCNKEVEDTYLENGWIKIDGSISRSWGTRSQGTSGDARTDYLDGKPEFCSIGCLVKALDKKRAEKKGPPPPEATPLVEVDPFKVEAPPKKPWEDPLEEPLPKGA